MSKDYITKTVEVEIEIDLEDVVEEFGYNEILSKCLKEGEIDDIVDAIIEHSSNSYESLLENLESRGTFEDYIKDEGNHGYILDTIPIETISSFYTDEIKYKIETNTSTNLMNKKLSELSINELFSFIRSTFSKSTLDNLYEE